MSYYQATWTLLPDGYLHLHDPLHGSSIVLTPEQAAQLKRDLYAAEPCDLGPDEPQPPWAAQADARRHFDVV